MVRIYVCPLECSTLLYRSGPTCVNHYEIDQVFLFSGRLIAMSIFGSLFVEISYYILVNLDRWQIPAVFLLVRFLLRIQICPLPSPIRYFLCRSLRSNPPLLPSIHFPRLCPSHFCYSQYVASVSIHLLLQKLHLSRLPQSSDIPCSRRQHRPSYLDFPFGS